MQKIILIERYPPSSFYWPNLLKMKKIPELSVEQILNKYQGFEGKCISLYPINTPESEFKEIIDLFFEAGHLNKYVMLYIISGSNKPPALLNDIAIPVGFDIGICEEERTIYSSIFNEILFGYFNNLISFKHHLNENFLFPDQSLAEKYLEVHSELAAQGKGVEQGVEMTIYKIWKFNSI